MECRPVDASTAERVTVLDRVGVGWSSSTTAPVLAERFSCRAGHCVGSRWRALVDFLIFQGSAVGGLFGLQRFSKLVFHPLSDQCTAEQHEENVDNKIVLAA